MYLFFSLPSSISGLSRRRRGNAAAGDWTEVEKDDSAHVSRYRANYAEFITRLTVTYTLNATGTGRVVPLNARILSVLEMWATHFPGRQPNHYVFPFEKYGAKGEEDTFGFTPCVVAYDTDPTRPIGDWKEA
jgi:hypothetical protein